MADASQVAASGLGTYASAAQNVVNSKKQREAQKVANLRGAMGQLGIDLARFAETKKKQQAEEEVTALTTGYSEALVSGRGEEFIKGSGKLTLQSTQGKLTRAKLMQEHVRAQQIEEDRERTHERQDAADERAEESFKLQVRSFERGDEDRAAAAEDREWRRAQAQVAADLRDAGIARDKATKAANDASLLLTQRVEMALNKAGSTLEPGGASEVFERVLAEQDWFELLPQSEVLSGRDRTIAKAAVENAIRDRYEERDQKALQRIISKQRAQEISLDRKLKTWGRQFSGDATAAAQGHVAGWRQRAIQFNNDDDPNTPQIPIVIKNARDQEMWVESMVSAGLPDFLNEMREAQKFTASSPEDYHMQLSVAKEAYIDSLERFTPPIDTDFGEMFPPMSMRDAVSQANAILRNVQMEAQKNPGQPPSPETDGFLMGFPADEATKLPPEQFNAMVQQIFEQAQIDRQKAEEHYNKHGFDTPFGFNYAANTKPEEDSLSRVLEYLNSSTPTPKVDHGSHAR